MDVFEFQYDLPAHLIAQHPSTNRDRSRLMVVDRQSGQITHRLFFEIVHELLPGDALLVNNTRVIKAKLVGQKKTGGKAEVLLTKCLQLISRNEEIWRCLVRSSKRPHPGTVFCFHQDLIGEALSVSEGFCTIRFRSEEDFRKILERVGRVPLPPYIRRRDGPDLQEDGQRYQTVFAEQDGAIAAPTAGLHFTSSLMSEIQRAGVSIISLTLHIGVGTFLPVRADRIEEHQMHEETFVIPAETAETVNRVKREGGRIIASCCPWAGPNRFIYLPPISVPCGRRSGDQLSPSRLNLGDACLGLCRKGSDIQSIRGRHRPRVSVLQLWRCHDDCLTIEALGLRLKA